MKTVRMGILAGLVSFLSATSLAAENRPETCSQVDEDAYTLYVYGDTDARILLDQACQSPTGESHLERVIEKAECRCYDKKFNEVLTQLAKNGGPVPVMTRKLTAASANVTCKTALEQCQSACTETAKTAPKPCAEVSTAGIVLY